MFCARCGEQIPDASETCPVCGREASLQLPPASAHASFAAAPALAPVSAASPPIRSDLQGVGGWLLFFCIGLVILGPLVVLREVTSATDSDSSGIVLELARTAFGVVLGILIWNVRQVAFTLLWIYFGLVVVISILGIIGSTALADEGQGNALALMYSIRSLIYAVIWFFYFRKSQRVRATFGRNL